MKYIIKSKNKGSFWLRLILSSVITSLLYSNIYSYGQHMERDVDKDALGVRDCESHFENIKDSIEDWKVMAIGILKNLLKQRQLSSDRLETKFNSKFRGMLDGYGVSTDSIRFKLYIKGKDSFILVINGDPIVLNYDRETKELTLEDMDEHERTWQRIRGDIPELLKVDLGNRPRYSIDNLLDLINQFREIPKGLAGDFIKRELEKVCLSNEALGLMNEGLRKSKNCTEILGSLTDYYKTKGDYFRVGILEGIIRLEEISYLIADGRLDEAEVDIMVLLESNPHNIRANYLLAKIYFIRGEYYKAKSLLKFPRIYREVSRDIMDFMQEVDSAIVNKVKSTKGREEELACLRDFILNAEAGSELVLTIDHPIRQDEEIEGILISGVNEISIGVANENLATGLGDTAQGHSYRYIFRIGSPGHADISFSLSGFSPIAHTHQYNEKIGFMQFFPSGSDTNNYPGYKQYVLSKYGRVWYELKDTDKSGGLYSMLSPYFYYISMNDVIMEAAHTDFLHVKRFFYELTGFDVNIELREEYTDIEESESDDLFIGLVKAGFYGWSKTDAFYQIDQICNKIWPNAPVKIKELGLGRYIQGERHRTASQEKENVQKFWNGKQVSIYSGMEEIKEIVEDKYNILLGEISARAYSLADLVLLEIEKIHRIRQVEYEVNIMLEFIQFFGNAIWEIDSMIRCDGKTVGWHLNDELHRLFLNMAIGKIFGGMGSCIFHTIISEIDSIQDKIRELGRKNHVSSRTVVFLRNEIDNMERIILEVNDIDGFMILQLYSDGRYDEIINRYKDKNTTEYYFAITLAYLAKGDFKGAEDTIYKAIERFNSRIEFLTDGSIRGVCPRYEFFPPEGQGEEKAYMNMEIILKKAEEKGVPPQEIEDLFNLFKNGIDILVNDPELNTGEIDGSYFTLIREISRLADVSEGRLMNWFSKEYLNGRHFRISDEKIIHGTRLYKAAKRLKVYNDLYGDVNKLAGMVPEEIGKKAKQVVVVFHIDMFKDMPLVGLKAVLNGIKGGNNVKLGLRLPSNWDREKIMDWISKDWELKGNIILLPDDILDAKEAPSLADKDVVFVVDEGYKVPEILKGVKIFGISRDSSFYAVFLFGLAYARVEDVSGLSEFLNVLSITEPEAILEKMRNRDFFVIKLLRTQGILEEFEIRRIYIDVAA